MKRLTSKLISGLLGCGIAVAGWVGGANAEVDFSGKRIELLVTTAEGGGADLYARFLGPLIAERLPGKPTMIVRNNPGAGSIAGSNQFQDRAVPDGTNLIVASASVFLNFILRDSRGHYKLNEWIPIISSSSGTVVYANTSLGVKEAKDLGNLGDKQLVMGANSPSSGDLRVLLPLDLIGANVKPIFGMNRADVYPGFQRGEINFDFSVHNAYQEQILPMVQEGIAVPLFTLGYTDATGKIVRDPAMPELPHFLEVYEQIKGEPLSGPALDVWNAIFNLNVMTNRAIFLPAGTPQDIVDAYQTAVDQLLADIQKDPELKKRADEILGIGEQATGEEAIRNVKNAATFSEDTYNWLRNWIKEKYDVTL